MAKLKPEDKILRNKIKLRVAELRKDHGSSKSDLSKDLEIDRQNFHPWENTEDETRGMSIYSINRTCKILGITLSEFFNDPSFNED